MTTSVGTSYSSCKTVCTCRASLQMVNRSSTFTHLLLSFDLSKLVPNVNVCLFYFLLKGFSKVVVMSLKPNLHYMAMHAREAAK